MESSSHMSLQTHFETSITLRRIKRFRFLRLVFEVFQVNLLVPLAVQVQLTTVVEHDDVTED